MTANLSTGYTKLKSTDSQTTVTRGDIQFTQQLCATISSISLILVALYLLYICFRKFKQHSMPLIIRYFTYIYFGSCIIYGCSSLLFRSVNLNTWSCYYTVCIEATWWCIQKYWSYQFVIIRLDTVYGKTPHEFKLTYIGNIVRILISIWAFIFICNIWVFFETNPDKTFISDDLGLFCEGDINFYVVTINGIFAFFLNIFVLWLFCHKLFQVCSFVVV